MNQLHLKQSIVAGAIALALGVSGTAFANDNTNSRTSNTTTGTTDTSMTGKQKATAIGAGSGAVAGAVVGGPVGALVGAGIGAYVGNKGTDANGKVDGNATTARSNGAYGNGNSDVRRAQTALRAQGYNLSVDGVHGPNTESAIRDYQAKNGLTETGSLDNATRERLGLKG